MDHLKTDRLFNPEGKEKNEEMRGQWNTVDKD